MAEVETSHDGTVLTVTLNRPDVLNALNAATHKALAAALRDARSDDVRAVVITGAGRGFCVGQDLNEFREEAGDNRSRPPSTQPPNTQASRPRRKAGVATATSAPARAGGLSP